MSHTVSAQEQAVEVVKIPSPQLHELGMSKNGKDMEGWLLLHVQIISVVKFFGADWDGDMAKEAANLAYQVANWMTVAEVKYFINRIKCGKYPSHKNFTPAIFMECLNGYINEVLSTRGAVTSYSWRDRKIPDELFPINPNPDTGEIKEADPDMIKKTLKVITGHIRDIQRRMAEQEEQDRKERVKALKDARDQMIIDSIEKDASQGIAPDKYMMKVYFEALERLDKK